VQGESGILVIQDSNVVLATENFGYIGPATPIVAGILIDTEITQSYITGRNLYPYLARLNNELQNIVPGWKMRITGRKRHGYRGKDGKKFLAGSFFVDYIAIDEQIGSNTKKARLPRRRIDIINLELIIDHPPTKAVDQLQMAMAIIDLQRKRRIKKIRSTRGAIGSALLKQSPNWEKKRHAAPRFINRFSRQYLPGNYYAISSRVTKQSLKVIPSAYYIDQTSCHHNIAKNVRIPHPHYIRARGCYRAAMESRDYYPVWKTKLEKDKVGLILAKVTIQHLPPTTAYLYPPWMRKKQRYVWIWTPELRLFENDSRLQLDSIVAGFLGATRDTAISEYADWSLNYLTENNGPKQYTKSILLAAYGMLAFNAENYTKQYRYWGGQVSGNKVNLPQAGLVSERVIKFRDGIQNSLANVIARGIIEAETRTRTLEYAKELSAAGHHVAQIYADGLLIQSEQLPFIRGGWRIAESLTNIYIPYPNAIISDQLTKLPGIPHTEQDRIWLDKFKEAQKPLTCRRGPATIELVEP
jgi:hypothetical protein